MTMSFTRGSVRNALPLVPFFIFLLIFLIIPTVSVVNGSISQDGSYSLDKLAALSDGAAMGALLKSVLLSAVTAVIGAVLGAVLAWLPARLPARHLVPAPRQQVQRGGFRW